MRKILDEWEQNEKNVLVPQDSASDDESKKLDELSFP
jgi:hypothetical protein